MRNNYFFSKLYGLCSIIVVFRISREEKSNGNANLGKLWFVFPPYISCIGRDFLWNVLVKVPVMLLLSLQPEMRTEFEPFSTTVILLMETCFELVGSRFKTQDEGIWSFFTLLSISCKNVRSTSFFASAEILTFPVVPARLTNPMRWNRLMDQVQLRNCTWLSIAVFSTCVILSRTAS